MTEELDKILADIAKLNEIRKLCEEGWVIKLSWNPEDKWVDVHWTFPRDEAKERERLRRVAREEEEEA